MTKLLKPELVNLKNHPEFTEKVIQQMIADDPSIIGLGDLIMKDKERPQPRAGRLDLLLQDPDTHRRFEVEIQLGKSDESHIIRTVEYWDIERKRYPQYDHCAVIIAEDITSRFLNVISLFNGFIPLIAIQMNAYKVGDEIGLVFTKVLDEMPLGLIDEDESVQEITDRNYWINTKATESTVKMADKILEIVNSFKDGYELNYTKGYIGFALNGQANNFALCKPKKTHLRLEIKLPQSEETDQFIEESGLNDMGYDSRWRTYKIKISKGEISKKHDVFKQLLEKAEQYRNS